MSSITKEKEMRNEILNLVKEYCDIYHKRKEYEVGDKISYAGRFYDYRDMQSLVDSSLDFWLTSGKYTIEFEKKLAHFLGIKYCSAVNSGSSANLLAFYALTSHLLGDKAIKKGDEILTVSAAFPTTVAPIIQFGAIPVFIDIKIPEYNIDTDMLEKAVNEKTKAIMLAHTLGNPFNLEKIRAFCDKHNLWLIEDNCDSLGSKYFINNEWKYTGTISDIGTSSFYPPHHITMGEGGAVYTNNKLLDRILRSLRDWGRDCWCQSGEDNTCQKRFDKQFGDLPIGYDHKYVYSHFGFNMKITDMQAAIGCTQLDKLSNFISARRKNWSVLKEGFSKYQDKFILPRASENSEPSWFGFMVTIKSTAGFKRDDIVKYLENNNIQTRNLFAGNIIKQPCFENMYINKDYKIIDKLNNTDIVMNNSFWIGVYPGMNNDMLNYIIGKVKEFIESECKENS